MLRFRKKAHEITDDHETENKSKHYELKNFKRNLMIRKEF